MNPLPPSTSLSSGITTTSIWAESMELPAPVSVRPGKLHRRSRTTNDLPPLMSSISRPPRLNPSRSLPMSRSTSPSKPPSSPRSPTHEIDDLDFANPECSDVKPQRRGSKFASWFSGTSEPLSVGILPTPIKEEGEAPQTPEKKPMADLTSPSDETLSWAAQQRNAARFQKRFSESAARPQAPTSYVPRRLSFFRFGAAPKASTAFEPSDELAKLDINSALFPHGPNDEFSPSAFMNLRMNAEGTLRKFQSAYNEAIQSLHDVRSERNIQADELEASKTRGEHLKLQLEEMAEKAVQQEKAIQELANELAAEKERRQEEEAYRKRSLKLVTTHPSDMFGEDINRKHSRLSDASSIQDFDGASEISSAHDSVFSHPEHSASRTPSTRSSAPSTPRDKTSPEINHHSGHKFTPFVQLSPSTPTNTTQTTKTSSQQQQPPRPLPSILSGNDKTPTLSHQPDLVVFPPATKDMQPPSSGSPTTTTTTTVVDGECRICHGIRSHEAWDVISVLKEESKALKETISQLEGGLESTLDYVSTLV